MILSLSILNWKRNVEIKTSYIRHTYQDPAGLQSIVLKLFQLVFLSIDLIRKHLKDKRPIHLYLIFEKSSWKNQVRRTGFLVYF